MFDQFDTDAPRPPRRATNPAIVLVIVAMLLVAGAGVWLFVRGRAEPSTASAVESHPGTVDPVARKVESSIPIEQRKKLHLMWCFHFESVEDRIELKFKGIDPTNGVVEAYRQQQYGFIYTAMGKTEGVSRQQVENIEAEGDAKGWNLDKFPRRAAMLKRIGK